MSSSGPRCRSSRRCSDRSCALDGCNRILVRAPAKVVVVDLRRKRWLDRSRLALQIAAAQLFVLGAAVGAAILLAGWSWFVPVVVAAPLVAVEMSFEIRSGARKLMPELCGAIAVAAVAGSFVIAAGRSSGLAAGCGLCWPLARLVRSRS